MLKILFDGDMLLFRASASCEREIKWDDEIWTLHSDAKEVKAKFDEMVLTYADNAMQKMKYEGEYQYIICFTSPNSFRKKLLPSYKENRKDKRKPLAYYNVLRWVKENYNCVEADGLEADDCIGIMATLYAQSSIIISGDKDFKTIPGLFYDFIHNELHIINKVEADYWHLYQTLVGDTTDNYKGCPKVGAVSAKRLLEKYPTWQTVVQAYEKAGLSEHEALIQARVARILRAEDYDLKTKEIILWSPV